MKDICLENMLRWCFQIKLCNTMEYHIKLNHWRKFITQKEIQDLKTNMTIVESFVDMNIVHRLDTEKQGNYSVNDVLVSESIVEKLDEIIAQRK